jgi:hypothetical protein
MKLHCWTLSRQRHAVLSLIEKGRPAQTIERDFLSTAFQHPLSLARGETHRFDLAILVESSGWAAWELEKFRVFVGVGQTPTSVPVEEGEGESESENEVLQSEVDD